MLNPAIWKKLCDPRTHRKPLVFVAGLRHRVKSGEYCGMHSHRDTEIVYHPTGSGVTRRGNRDWAFEEGSVVVYAPGEKHDQRMESGGEDLCVQITLPAGMRADLRSGFAVPRVDSPWLAEEMQQLCGSNPASGQYAQHILDLRATAVLLALVDAACTATADAASSVAVRRVKRAENFINAHFQTINSLQEVASHVGVSADHLRHLFKSMRGRSLVRHLNEVKVARARLLLTNSPLPLKQIATMCGYKDEYYFSAVFRKLTTLAPGAYRNRSFPEKTPGT